MKAFLTKYKHTIIFWLVLTGILGIFVPMQRADYLKADIDKFEDEYFTSALFWIWGVICVIWILVLFINTTSVKNSIVSLLYASFMSACFLFLFKDVILGGTLFINKLYKRDTSQKEYTVIQAARKEQSGLFLLDLENQTVASDDKLREKLYRPELKPQDTLTLPVDIGLLGIAFPHE